MVKFVGVKPLWVSYRIIKLKIDIQTKSSIIPLFLCPEREVKNNGITASIRTRDFSKT